MTDITITPANVIPAANAEIATGRAGATIAAGQAVYRDSADGLFKLADADAATAVAREPYGVALNGAAASQPLSVLTSGDIALGAVMTAGTAYFLSAGAGGICPEADLGAGDYPCFLGIARSTSVLRVNITPSGIAL